MSNNNTKNCLTKTKYLGYISKAGLKVGSTANIKSDDSNQRSDFQLTIVTEIC